MKYTESFNSRSRVNDYYSENIEENLIPDYDALNYVRIMKRFSTRNYQSELSISEMAVKNTYGYKQLSKKYKKVRSSKVEKNKINFNEEFNKPFHLRCYIPKSKITNKSKNEENDDLKKEIHKVVIMFNGLNEVSNFDFYDIMGEFFVNNGMTAILLPTPFHLNRRVSREFIVSNPEEEEISKSIVLNPIEFANPLDKIKENLNGDIFYASFLKSHLELSELIDKIKGTYYYTGSNLNKIQEDLDESFYKMYFPNRKNTEFILLGYSLGGLRSMSYFLSNPELFRCCISFNSGANLLNSLTEELKISEQTWESILLDCQLKVDDQSNEKVKNNENILSVDSKKNEKLRQAFLTLYFGEVKATIRKELDKNINKYLAISGGGDKIVNLDQMKQIAPKNKHIHQVIVAGVNHHPTIDPNWYDVLPRIEKNIVDFINTCNEEHWTKEKVVEVISNYFIDSEGTTFFTDKLELYKDLKNLPEFTYKDLIELIDKIDKKGKDAITFIHFYYISKAYYPAFEDLLHKIYMKRSKERENMK